MLSRARRSDLDVLEGLFDFYFSHYVAAPL
jgi:hypothetical protein